MLYKAGYTIIIQVLIEIVDRGGRARRFLRWEILKACEWDWKKSLVLGEGPIVNTGKYNKRGMIEFSISVEW